MNQTSQAGAVMLVDAHVHLQPHGECPVVDRARIERYVEQARANGVDVLVFTEHLFRFHEALTLLDGWWHADIDPRLAAMTEAYLRDEVNLSLPEYVRVIEEAKADGLPVRLGLEMDWVPGHADDLRRLLKPYAWDVILGSVHAIGSFQIDHEDFRDEWQRRDVAAVWDEYARCVEELADARLVDVLAHPDLPKVWGLRPPDLSRVHGRIVAAAARGDLALEINTNGLRKAAAEIYPHPDVLRAARAARVPVTLASDAHVPERVGAAFAEAIVLARETGYVEYAAFERREQRAMPLPSELVSRRAATALTPSPSPAAAGEGSLHGP
jgi:histidinol-phosphatase (PHP family)